MPDAKQAPETPDAPVYEPPQVEDLERCEGASVTAAAVSVGT